MKKKQFFKNVMSLMAGVLLVFASCTTEETNTKEVANVSGVRSEGYVTSENGNVSSKQGTSGSFFWTLYQEGGKADITQGANGNFAITYSGCNDVVGGKGWNPGSAKNIGYNIGSLSGSYDFVGVYGWTTSPLIEYYICEKGNNINGSAVNTVSSDGHTYNFVRNQRVNAPSIIGTATFWQYIDRWGGSSTGSNKTITMANHINNWKSKGGKGFGTFNYQELAIEAFGGKTGSINATVW